MAERRDLMVDTYSSYCGTGAAAMVCVCTGMACGAACGGGADLVQAVSASTERGMQRLIQTGNFQNRTLMHGLVYSSCSASDPNRMRSETLQG